MSGLWVRGPLAGVLRAVADRLVPPAVVPQPAAVSVPRAELRARCLALARCVRLEADWLVVAETSELHRLGLLVELELQMREVEWLELERHLMAGGWV